MSEKNKTDVWNYYDTTAAGMLGVVPDRILQKPIYKDIDNNAEKLLKICSRYSGREHHLGILDKGADNSVFKSDLLDMAAALYFYQQSLIPVTHETVMYPARKRQNFMNFLNRTASDNPKSKDVQASYQAYLNRKTKKKRKNKLEAA